ncbi:hypothetical protein [Nitrosomonas sp. wSCUT-2]
MITNKPLKNVFEAADTRQKQARKRSLCGINEYFELVFNTVAATQIVSQRSAKEALINSTNVMKGEAHGTQQPRHINLIGEGVSTAQRNNSLVQSINQRFPKRSIDCTRRSCHV